jgi:hypothetical protein
MSRHRFRASIVATTVLLVGAPAFGSPAQAASGATSKAGCSSSAHSLAPIGSRLYPDTGDGGYVSVHTDIHMVYDAVTDLFLPGNHVDLTDRSTQCLTDFSLDFERHSANQIAGPGLTVTAITVDGRPARYTFVQPTYRVIRTAKTIRIPPHTKCPSSTPSADRTITRCRPRAHRN